VNYPFKKVVDKIPNTPKSRDVSHVISFSVSIIFHVSVVTQCSNIRYKPHEPKQSTLTRKPPSPELSRAWESTKPRTDASLFSYLKKRKMQSKKGFREKAASGIFMY